MEFKEYLAILRRRWVLFLPIFLLVVGAHLAWVSYLQTDRYAATSKVVIGNDEIPRGAGFENFSASPWKSLSRNTKEATIGDYPVLRRAAELARGDIEFRSPQFSDPKIAARVTEGIDHIRSMVGEGEKELEWLIGKIRSSVAVSGISDGQMVEITTVGPDPTTPLILSWAVAEAASQFHDEKARENVEMYLEDLGEQIETAERDLETAQEELATAQMQSGIASFDDEQRMILDAIYRLDEDDARLQAQLRKNDKMIQFRLQEQSFGGRVDASAIAALENDPEVRRIRGKLIEAKIDLDSKVGSLSQKNPEVQRAKSVVAGLEALLAETQERLLTERYQHFSSETNELIQQNSLIALEREVLAERETELDQQLQELHRQRRIHAPIEMTFDESKRRLDDLRSVEKRAEWVAAGQLGSVVVHDPAASASPVPPAGTGPGPFALTVIMAFIFALGVVSIVEYVDTRMKSEQDVRRILDLPLLGIIPKDNDSGGLLTDVAPQSEISEKFNTAATLIGSVSDELNLRSFMVCSSIAKEGKTTVSVNLAVALARKGASVVLVDGDLRMSQLHHMFGCSNEMGLSSILDGQVQPTRIIEGALTDADYAGRVTSALDVVQRTFIANLDVLSAGPPNSEPVQLLESGRLARMVAELKQRYDFVIFDTPPINRVGDALTISSAVDGTLFVVGAGQAEQEDVAWAKHLLTNVQANVLGVFLNKFSKQRGGEYGYAPPEPERTRRSRRSRSFA